MLLRCFHKAFPHTLHCTATQTFRSTFAASSTRPHALRRHRTLISPFTSPLSPYAVQETCLWRSAPSLSPLTQTHCTSAPDLRPSPMHLPPAHEPASRITFQNPNFSYPAITTLTIQPHSHRPSESPLRARPCSHATCAAAQTRSAKPATG